MHDSLREPTRNNGLSWTVSGQRSMRDGRRYFRTCGLVKALWADRAARTCQRAYAAAALSRSDFILQFELTRRRPLRRNPRFLPAIRFDRRRLRLVPGKYAMRSGALAQTHGLRAGEPLF